MFIKKHILTDIKHEIDNVDCNVFVNELIKIYNAEQKLNTTLPSMILNAESPKIANGLIKHLKFTQEHLLRLETFFKSINQPINKI
jgi:ferritin-like metal-binding protein YciE